MPKVTCCDGDHPEMLIGFCQEAGQRSETPEGLPIPSGPKPTYDWKSFRTQASLWFGDPQNPSQPMIGNPSGPKLIYDCKPFRTQANLCFETLQDLSQTKIGNLLGPKLNYDWKPFRTQAKLWLEFLQDPIQPTKSPVGIFMVLMNASISGGHSCARYIKLCTNEMQLVIAAR